MRESINFFIMAVVLAFFIIVILYASGNIPDARLFAILFAACMVNYFLNLSRDADEKPNQ